MGKAARWFIYLLLFFWITGCADRQNEASPNAREQHLADSLSEAAIDSAYASITRNCDTLVASAAKILADSFYRMKEVQILKKPSDSTLHAMVVKLAEKQSINPVNWRHYPVEMDKVNKVIARLREDCDTSLLKETYIQVLKQRGSVKRPTPVLKKPHG